MKQDSMIGKAVTLNADLIDIKGNAHPLAGQTVIILNKVRKAYQADDNKGGMAIFHDGDFTTTPAVEGNTYIHVAGISSQIVTVPLGDLHECPFNPRKRFDEAALAELTETVKAVGIMQPLLVRRVQEVVGGSTVDWLEIVFGHRRYRAAKLASLLEAPVMIRDLTDAQSARLQAIENLQREDLDPIEEAQGYADYCKAHKINKQELADYIGVSRTTVFNQLKLLELCPEGQALVQRGALGTELATHIARVGSHEVQAPVLKKVFYGADLATATKETKAMSLRQGVALLEAIETPKAAAKKTQAKPARFDLLTHLARQRTWSEKTFGPGDRAKGVVDHIRKELREIEADPKDLSEWIDVVILALDGAWRAGGSPQQIIEAITAKQTKNEGRTWPDWRTMPADKAIEHDRSADKATT